MQNARLQDTSGPIKYAFNRNALKLHDSPSAQKYIKMIFVIGNGQNLQFGKSPKE